MRDAKEPRPVGLQDPPAGKRQYEKPRILFREPFHAFAALCNPGKGSGDPGDCQINANS